MPRSFALSSPIRSKNFRATVLCIDDDDIGLQVRRLVLESEGYHVLLAESGPAGLALLARRSVDCVVLDYRMPIMDGSVVALEIKRSWPELPVIIFSGFPDEIPANLTGAVEATLSKADGPRPLLRELARLAERRKNGRPRASASYARKQKIGGI